jgi:flagella basal body P-ring formation protein FlgA
MARHMIRNLAFALAATAAFSGAAAAQNTLQPLHPQLKAEATVTGPVVKVGDLIDNAGIIANVPIFRAPDLGQSGTVPVAAVVEAVRAHALIGLDTDGLDEVRVTRASRAIPVATIQQAVALSLSARYQLGDVKDIAVNFERDPRIIYVEPNASGEPRVAQIAYDKVSGRFDTAIEIPTGAGANGKLRLNGTALVTGEVVTLSHAIERGAVIRAGDIAVERRPRTEIVRDAVADREIVVGMAARGALRAGQPLRTTDLMKPELVARGAAVTMYYQIPGISLTVRGKATEAGAEGDTISVINETSKRTLQGVVIGPNRVVVSPTTPRLAANLPPSTPSTHR